MDLERIKILLDSKVEEFEHPDFIQNDPIQIPHLFTAKPDIEIAAFFAATLAWGHRNNIINSCNRLLERMDHAPHDFVMHHQASDLEKMKGFVHRTFKEVDLLYFLKWLQWFYSNNQSLETAFFYHSDVSVKDAIIHFHDLFFSLPDAPQRTRKHVSTPFKKSASKRLNMMLRWMVRKDSEVDFGIWNRVDARALMLPLDVHTGNVSRALGILKRTQNDWESVAEITAVLQKFCPEDPVKYDYALFGMGVSGEWKNRLDSW